MSTNSNGAITNLINQPDALRLIYGLRDTGYNFNTAAADVIDNSIAANASEVNVQILLMEDGRKFVAFGDDGDGMDEKALFEAMRYGAPVRSNLASLGKFGLGLKTASSSVCLKFTVISRVSSDTKLAKLAWDLEHVEERNAWEMMKEDVTSYEREWFEELCGEKGTLVIWSKCDRLLSKEYKHPGGTSEQRAVLRLADQLRNHIGLIYYRFLDCADNRERNISIYVNGETVNYWNPFFPERSEQVLAENQQVLEIELMDGRIQTASIRAWILPNRRDLCSDEQKIARITNRGQGFYIHREGRVIQQGGWLGVFGAVEPHTSLLRIEFDFSHKLDEAFKVDVKKSKILFDPALEEYLKNLLQPTYREAGNRYRRKEKAEVAKHGIDHGSSNRAISSTPIASKPSVVLADPISGTATIQNNRGPAIKLRVSVEPNIDPNSIYVEAVDDINSGDLWESRFGGAESDFAPGVRINKHHDFYQKIYQRATANGYAVEGMDLLLWAFSVAEQNNVNEELAPIFEDIRQEVSSNLRKLLREFPMPDDEDLSAAEIIED